MTARNVSFEPPKRSDWRDLAALLTSTGLPTSGLEHHLATTLIARDGGGIVGSVALEVYGADALLRSLAVSRERRNEGLGRRLTAAARRVAAGARTARGADTAGSHCRYGRSERVPRVFRGSPFPGSVEAPAGARGRGAVGSGGRPAPNPEGRTP